MLSVSSVKVKLNCPKLNFLLPLPSPAFLEIVLLKSSSARDYLYYQVVKLYTFVQLDRSENENRLFKEYLIQHDLNG